MSFIPSRERENFTSVISIASLLVTKEHTADNLGKRVKWSQLCSKCGLFQINFNGLLRRMCGSNVLQTSEFICSIMSFISYVLGAKIWVTCRYTKIKHSFRFLSKYSHRHTQSSKHFSIQIITLIFINPVFSNCHLMLYHVIL